MSYYSRSVKRAVVDTDLSHNEWVDESSTLDYRNWFARLNESSLLYSKLLMG